MASGETTVKGFLFLALAACLIILCAPITPAADDTKTARPAGTGDSKEAGVYRDDCGSIDTECVIRIALDNGLTARIYTAGYFIRSLRESNGRTIVVLDDGEDIEVITDTRDPLIGNEGDGSFHPFDEEHVVRALGEITYPALRVDIDVYILPFPRRELPASSTRGSEIFLSPDVRELSYEGAAFIVAHEIGHAFQNCYLPLRDVSRWSEYERLRAIEDERIFSAEAEHAYRPVEIYAEDFRVLFGGEAARYDGRVENPELRAPECAAGIEEFFLSLSDAGVRREGREFALCPPSPGRASPAGEEIAAGRPGYAVSHYLRRVLNLPSLL